MARCVAQLPSLRDAILLQLETASVSAEVQLAFKRRLFCGGGGSGNGPESAQPLLSTSSRLRNATTRLDTNPGILASSLAYVTCWLAGQEFRSSTRHCGARKSYRDPAFGAHSERLSVENRWRLHQLMSQREAQANQFGYTFKAFHRLAKLPGTDVLRARVSTAASAPEPAPQQLGVVTSWLRVGSALRPYLVVPPPASSKGAAIAASASGSTASSEASTPPPPPPPPLLGETGAGTAVRNVLVVFHKMGTDKEKPTGMDLRMAQVVESLVALQVRVHFVCQCDVDPSQLSPFGRGVTIYVGSMQQQYDQAMKASELSGGLGYAYVFFTTFTMEVHHRQLTGDPDWYKEPAEPLPEERIVSWLHARSAAAQYSSSKPPFCVSAVADDIHYLRAVQVLGHPENLRDKAEQASVWIKKRELAFHASVHNVVTVSSEDAATLRGVLESAPPPPPGSWAATTRRADCNAGHCSCDPLWVPYTHEFVSEASVEPYARRRDGMLYVGGMHGLAVVAMQWLVTQVQPLIASLSPLGERALQPGGLGHLHLVGPGWESHLSELGAIKTSVEQGRATILGTLSEPQLNHQLAELKVFVAPVFNGTGIATKNVMAMARGIPLVTTTVGLQGLGLPADQDAILTADAPDAFASKVVAVQTAESAWDATWRGALAHTRRYLSADHQRDVLCELMRCSRPPPSAHSGGDGGDSGGLSPLLCPFGSQQQQLTTVRTVVTRALAPPRSSNASAASTALVVLGLEGSGASAIARSLLAWPRLCVHPEPLAGLERAPLSAQLDHLRSLLSEPAYCKEALRLGPLPNVHGFALEFGVAEGGATAVPGTEVLGTRRGLLALARLVSDAASRLVLVRRCNTVAWATGLVLASQPSPCDSSASSSAGATCSGDAAGSLSSARLSTTITACRRSDVALRRLSAAVGSLCGSLCQALQPLRQPLQSLTVDLELMQPEGSDVPRLATFLGLPASTTLRAPVVAAEAAAGRVFASGSSNLGAMEAVLAADATARQQLASIVAAGSASLSARTCDASWRQNGEAASESTRSDPACTSGEQECALHTAVTAFAQQHQLEELEAPMAPPIIAIGAHSDEGGGAALSRILAQACRSVLTPRLGLRCAFRSGYDGCDPAVVDVCFLHEARFSEGRYTPRGYRYVHVRRDPAELLARRLMRLEPNATRTQNASTLLESVETQARLLLADELRDMAAVVEAHQSDRRTLPLKAEELLSSTRGNATMRRLFGFLLAGRGGGALVEDVVRAVWPAQQAAARAEAAGASQRQHLLKQLQRRPLKCHHFARMQATLGYEAMGCQERAAGPGGGGGAAPARTPRDAASRHTRRRRRRRLRGVVEEGAARARRRPSGPVAAAGAAMRGWSWLFGGRGDSSPGGANSSSL